MGHTQPSTQFADWWPATESAVRRAALEVLGSGHDADVDDVVQETSFVMWTRDRRGGLEFKAEGQFAAYAIVVARRRAIRAIRVVQRSRRLLKGFSLRSRPKTTTSDDDAVNAVLQALTSELGSAIQLLPERERRAVVLFMRGFTVRRIAQELGMSSSSADRLLHRAVDSLAAKLKSESNQSHAC